MAIEVDLRVDTKKAEAKLNRLGLALNTNTVLKLIGARLLYWVNENFVQAGAETKWKPLSRNTLSSPTRRGSPPLRVTGRLAQSFVSQIRSGEVAVGSSQKVATYQHFGTRPYVIRPRIKNALAFWTVNGRTIRRMVRHPGLPARPLLPSRGLTKRLAVETLQGYVDRVIQNSKSGGGVDDVSS